MKWWRIFENDLGPAGERPEVYWSPRLAEVCGLRPSDIGDLTAMQLHAAYSYSHDEE